MNIPKEAYFAAGALVVGGVAGYFIGVKRTLDSFKNPVEELGDLNSRIKALELEKQQAIADLNDIKKQEMMRLSAQINRYSPDDYAPDTDSVEVADEPSPKESNIFERGGDDDMEIFYEDNDKFKREGEPYIVTLEDHMEGQDGYDVSTLTYYDGDDVLCDSRDEIVDDVDGMINFYSLSRFGYLSNDANIVYVRNDRLKMDFEVCRVDGRYSEIVAGFVEHSDKPTLRKFRNSDY